MTGELWRGGDGLQFRSFANQRCRLFALDDLKRSLSVRETFVRSADLEDDHLHWHVSFPRSSDTGPSNAHVRVLADVEAEFTVS